jgi:hypothetical protein
MHASIPAHGDGNRHPLRRRKGRLYPCLASSASRCVPGQGCRIEAASSLHPCIGASKHPARVGVGLVEATHPRRHTGVGTLYPRRLPRSLYPSLCPARLCSCAGLQACAHASMRASAPVPMHNCPHASPAHGDAPARTSPPTSMDLPRTTAPAPTRGTTARPNTTTHPGRVKSRAAASRRAQPRRASVAVYSSQRTREARVREVHSCIVESRRGAYYTSTRVARVRPPSPSTTTRRAPPIP